MGAADVYVYVYVLKTPSGGSSPAPIFVADLGGVLEVSWGILGHMHIFIYIYICIYIVLAVVVAGDVANSPVFI